MEVIVSDDDVADLPLVCGERPIALGIAHRHYPGDPYAETIRVRIEGTRSLLSAARVLPTRC
ncbi:MAG: hypothetical protein QM674_19885 [Burkholderiaceae bacterium]